MRISDWSSDVCSSDLEHAHAAFILFLSDAQRLVQHPVRELPLFGDRFNHPGADHLEQARDDDHDRRLRFLDVRNEFFQALAVIDLRADHDRQELPARMLIGVTERQEREESLILRSEEHTSDLQSLMRKSY